jgi:similar to spore coat protein
VNPIIEKLTGIDVMTDQVIAMDYLITAKTGVRNYAIALTETATPEIKAVMYKQLQEAIGCHEQITNYMLQRGFYHPYDVNEQIELDIKNIQTALAIT